MKQKSPSQSGFLQPRVLFALLLCLLGASLAVVGLATTPATGTLSPANRVVNFTGGPFTIPTNSTDSAAGPVTCDAANPCEDFGLTIDIPQTYKDANPNDTIQIQISWADPTGGQDLDAFLVNDPDTGSAYPAHAKNGSDNPEVMTIPISAVVAGPQHYFVRVIPFVSTAQTFTGKVSLVSPSTPPPPPPPPSGPVPRYYNYSPGPGIGENAGEPSIGFNPATRKTMFISGLQTYRVTFPEDLAPAGSVSGACDALWEDVSYVVTRTKSLDPILFTSRGIGRTWVSQLDSVVPPASPVLIGLNSFMAYTDDDGASWTPAQINPPDGDYDHQSVGSGPYPTLLPLGNAINKGEAVYYCAQAGLSAFCARSDDGGLNFGRAVPIYIAVSGPTGTGCGGIHGHVKVAPDGTVYVPNYSCNGKQGVSVSTDGGTTWTVRTIPDSLPSVIVAPATADILDPSVAITRDAPVAPAVSNTIYFCYTGKVNATDNHAFCTTSKDRGITWTPSVDIGAGVGIQNAVFATAVSGDANRAACAFLGTISPGDHQAANFTGTWYGYIAHTYDGGQTWTTVNATPAGPVQRNACIWNGGGNNLCRNMLDFTDINMDDKGRVLFGFADGCINDCETGGANSYSSKATIARQSGGKGLLAQFDSPEPVLAQRACLSGTRDDLASYLHWIAPDNGGSDILSYNIYRGTAPGNEVLIGQASGTKTSYNDRGADPSVASYSYKITAVNALGQGAPSNNVVLTVGPRIESNGACGTPGVQVITDPTGDETDTLPQHDITSVSMAEPDSLPGKLVFTLKVAKLDTITPQFRWAVRFSVQGVTPPTDFSGGASEDFFVSMVTSDGPTPTFTWGVTSVPQGAARFFTTKGTLDPASNAAADGTITLIIPKATIGNPVPGQSIVGMLGSVRLSPPNEIPGTGGTNETIPDSTGGGSYTLRPANLCLPNTAPLAQLAADVDSGPKPLTVHFDGSASSDADSIDTIASYTFNFGEGADDVVQSSPTITHTFTNAGLYPVKLVVTDSRGKVSSNTALHLVQVQVPLQVVSRMTHGSAGTFDIPLPLTGTPAVECRNGGANGNFEMVFVFANPLTSVSGATLTGTGTVSNRSIGTDPHQYIVDLTGVTNAQTISVALSNVVDSTGPIGSVSASMSVLAGDTTGNGAVNSSDIAQTQSQSGQTVNQNNFREDVTVNGAINSSDVGFVQSKSGTALPVGGPASTPPSTPPKGKHAPRTKPARTRQS